MGMGFVPTWHRQVSPPPLLHNTTLTTEAASKESLPWFPNNGVGTPEFWLRKYAKVSRGHFEHSP